MRDFTGLEEPPKKGGRERKRWGCEARSKDIRDGILNDSFAIRLSFPPPPPPLSVPESALSDACRAAIYCFPPPPPPSLSHVDRSESSKKHDDSVPSRNGLPNLLWNLLFGTPAKRRHESEPRNLRRGVREFRDEFRAALITG